MSFFSFLYLTSSSYTLVFSFFIFHLIYDFWDPRFLFDYIIDFFHIHTFSFIFFLSSCALEAILCCMILLYHYLSQTWDSRSNRIISNPLIGYHTHSVHSVKSKEQINNHAATPLLSICSILVITSALHST